MADWIFTALYLLSAAAVAFWGWKRQEKPLWPVALVAFSVIALNELLMVLRSEGGGDWPVLLLLPLSAIAVLFRFVVAWLVWFLIGLVAKQLRQIVTTEGAQRIDAARWAAPIILLLAFYFTPWQVPAAFLVCCLVAPLPAWLWARRTGRLALVRVQGLETGRSE